MTPGQTFNILPKVPEDIFFTSLGSSLPLEDIDISILFFPAILWQRPHPIQRPLFTISLKLLITVTNYFLILL